jgi:hypothetical protein
MAKTPRMLPREIDERGPTTELPATPWAEIPLTPWTDFVVSGGRVYIRTRRPAPLLQPSPAAGGGER